MNILIVTPHFYPEIFRINDLAAEFVKRNHNIIVLTSIPNYPQGKYYDDYGIFRRDIQVYNNIKIYRAPVIPKGSGNRSQLALNYISYIIGGIFKSLFIKEKIDIIFVFETSPITVGLPAIFLKKIRSVPICFWVLDLWPESVISGGNLKSKLIPVILTPIVKYIYKNCDKILVTSRGYINSIINKGVSPKKIEYIPQWAESIYETTKTSTKFLDKIRKGDFVVMFAGNIGEAQDFESILDAAERIKNENIQWIILGSGRKEKWVKEQVKRRKIRATFHMMGSFPLGSMPECFANASAMLITLKKSDIFSLTIPGKLQSYMAASKPILGMIDGECKDLINLSKAGLACSAENPEALVTNIHRMCVMNKNKLKEMGRNGKKYYKENFERNKILSKIETKLHDLKAQSLNAK